MEDLTSSHGQSYISDIFGRAIRSLWGVAGGISLVLGLVLPILRYCGATWVRDEYSVVGTIIGVILFVLIALPMAANQICREKVGAANGLELEARRENQLLKAKLLKQADENKRRFVDAISGQIAELSLNRWNTAGFYEKSVPIVTHAVESLRPHIGEPLNTELTKVYSEYRSITAKNLSPTGAVFFMIDWCKKNPGKVFNTSEILGDYLTQMQTLVLTLD